MVDFEPMNWKKRLSELNLEENDELNFSIPIPELDRLYTKSKKIEQEQYQKISVNCLHERGMKYTTEKLKNELMVKLVLVLFSALFTYYAIYQITLVYLNNRLADTYYNLVLFLFLVLFTFLLFVFIYRRDFGKTQFMIYTLIYSIFSFFGVIAILLQLVPLTSYHIINLFVFILLAQIMILYLTTPITRGLVCRIDDNNVIDEFSF